MNLILVSYVIPTCFDVFNLVTVGDYFSPDCRKYSRVRRWTLGLTGPKELIAVIRASGSISRSRGPVSSSGVIAEDIIEKIRNARGILLFNIKALHL